MPYILSTALNNILQLNNDILLISFIYNRLQKEMNPFELWYFVIKNSF